MKFNLKISLTILIFFNALCNSTAQWKKIELPVTNTPISTQAVAAIGDTLLVGTYRSTIYRSTDKGITWSKSDSGINNIYWIKDFLIDANMIYAMGEDGIYRSTNLGDTWELKNNGLHSGNWINVYSMVKSGNHLFAATDFGVYRSPDNGDNWYPSNGDSSYWAIYSIAVLDGSLFAGSAGEGIFRSTDDGLSWTSINEGMPYNSSRTKRINKLYVDGENIYAGTQQWGIYYSSNNGEIWFPDTLGLQIKENGWYYPIFSLAKIDNYLYAGTQDDGIYRHSNTTGAWIKVDTNLPENSYVLSIINAGDRIFAATQEGLYSSPLDNINWIPALIEFPEKIDNILHIGSGWNNLFIAASANYYYGEIYSIFYTDNSGKTWLRDSVLSETYITDFKLYGDSLYAFGNGLFYTSNHSLDWIEIDSQPIDAFIKDNDTLFIGYGYSNDLFNFGRISFSVDHGQSWNKIWDKDTLVYAIEKIDNNLFAGTSHGMFRSENTGLNWVSINNGLPITDGKHSIVVSSLNTIDDNLFLNSNEGVYLSTNFGKLWRSVNDGLPIDTLGYNFIFLLTHDNLIFAGINNEIYFSEDLAENWMLISDGFLGDNRSIKELTVIGDDLVAATGYGLWKRSLSEIISAENDFIMNPTEYFLSQNYPNPFNSSTTIKYKIPKKGFVQIKVFDILGREISLLIDEIKDAGSYVVEFNSGNLPSGVYVYTLRAGEYYEAKRMVLLK